jgi:hypothetical protein
MFVGVLAVLDSDVVAVAKFHSRLLTDETRRATNVTCSRIVNGQGWY